MCPREQDPPPASFLQSGTSFGLLWQFGGLREPQWHQFWSALAASEWRLTEQTADRAYKRSQSEK